MLLPISASNGDRRYDGLSGSRGSLCMTVVAMVCASLLMLLVTPVAATATPGDLDTSFSSDGWTTTPFGVWAEAQDIAVQSDGKLVVVGSSGLGSGRFVVTRYDAAGVLDTDFDGDGIVTTDVGPSYAYAQAVAVQDDGKIVVVGNAVNDFAVVRYNTDGSLDTDFDTDGVVITPVGAAGYAAAKDVAIADGAIIVAGGAAASGGGNPYDFALARYTSTGALDTTFDVDGTVLTPIGSLNDHAYGVAVTADGSIIAAGYATQGSGNTNVALARYLEDGSLDTSFDADGKQTTAIGTGHSTAYDVAIQSTGAIVIGGEGGDGSTAFALARFTEGGSLDTSFSADGRLTTDVDTDWSRVRGMVLQPDDKIIAVGFSSDGVNSDVALARYTSDGELDGGFGLGGVVKTPIGSSNDWGYGVALQSNGRIVVAGVSDNGTETDFAVLRYRGGTLPTNSTPPHITGVSRVGNTLTCAPGSWTGGTTSGWQWLRNGVAITLAVTQTHTLVAADAGATISCAETASNSDGSATATSTGLLVLAAALADRCANLSGNQFTIPSGFIQLGSACNGDARNNTLRGTTGVDSINGLGGADTVHGLAGADTLNGGSGQDRLVGGPGRDILNGGAGNDTILANDHARGDRINCGRGRDVATVNRRDTTRGCERVIVRR